MSEDAFPFPLPPPMPRPKPPGSADSFPLVTPDQGEKILALLRELKENVAAHDDAIRELRENVTIGRELRSELRELSGDVRRVLSRDAEQERRLGELERMASAAGNTAGAHAGRAAGARWAGIGTVLGTMAAAAFMAALRSCS